MADLTKRIIFIVLYWISELRKISAAAPPFCEWNQCTPSQYCCKLNECCDLPNNIVYAIASISLGLLMGATCFGLFKCRHKICQLLFIRSEELKPFVSPSVET